MTKKKDKIVIPSESLFREYLLEHQIIHANSFVVDGQRFGTVEAFAQVIQLPESDPRRERLALLDQVSARNSKDCVRALGKGRPDSVYWNGQKIAFGSEKHRALMRRVVKAFRLANPNWKDIRSKKHTLPKIPPKKRPHRQLPEYTDLAVNVGVDENTTLLSNFAPSTFVLDGKRFASVEAFVQYIKYPDGAPYKEEIPELIGKYAKRRGKRANRFIEAYSCAQGGAFGGLYVYWQGQQIPYRSAGHMHLIGSAIQAKFSQNAEAREQLLATEDKQLIHNLGYPESHYTSLPADQFCHILTELRTRLIADQ